MGAQSRRPPHPDGYVTLAVLLVVGLLAAIASSLVLVSRPALGLSRIGGDEVAADGLIEGGVTTAAYLLYGSQREVAKVDGLFLRLATGDIRIAVEDEAARIDLNAADPPLLAGLFAAVKGTSMPPGTFANRVADWRDADSDTLQNGAEATDYEQAGLDYAPSNVRFHSVAELRFILGLSARDYDRLKPYLTVFSGRAGVDLLGAPEVVLRAIPGAGEHEVDQLLQARKTVKDRARLAIYLPESSAYIIGEPSGVYRVGADVQLRDGFAKSVEAVIEGPQEEDSADYHVVSWSRLESASASE